MKFSNLKMLTEMHYGSLINQDKYNNLDKADQALYKYTADGFTVVDSYFDKLSKRYPFEGGVLYRGLHFATKEEHDKFFKDFTEDYETGMASSWTPSVSTAEDFARTEKTYFPTLDVMKASSDMHARGDHMTGYGGVILKMHAPAGGIDVNKSDFAKESEVLLPAGKYNVSIFKELKPYHRQFKKMDDFAEVFSEIKKALKTNTKNSELSSQVTHLLASWKDKLTEEQADLVFLFNSAKYIKMAAETPEKFSVVKTEKDYFTKGERLIVQLHMPFDLELLPKCSTKVNKQVQKVIKSILAVFGAEVKKICETPDFSKITDYQFNELDKLKKVLDISQYIRPLRAKLADEYHRLNSREVSKTITDTNKMRDHAKLIQKLITAIASI